MVIGVGVLATPSYRQRIYSAKTVSSVRQSFTITGLLYLGFSFLPAIIGMAVWTMNPQLENSGFAFLFATGAAAGAGDGDPDCRHVGQYVFRQL